MEYSKEELQVSFNKSLVLGRWITETIKRDEDYNGKDHRGIPYPWDQTKYVDLTKREVTYLLSFIEVRSDREPSGFCPIPHGKHGYMLHTQYWWELINGFRLKVVYVSC